MVRYFCMAFTLSMAVLWPGTGLLAQLEIAEESPPTGPYVGLLVGTGSVPHTFFGGCSDYFRGADKSYPTSDRAGSVFGGVAIGVPIGPFRIEARNLSRMEMDGFDCILLEPVFESGVHTLHSPITKSGTKATSDVRVGLAIPFRLPLVVSAAAGWVWGSEIPYVSSGLGIRTKGRYKFTVDLLWEMYRMPFQLADQEWENYELVRTLRNYQDDDWQDAWSLQFGVIAYIR